MSSRLEAARLHPVERKYYILQVFILPFCVQFTKTKSLLLTPRKLQY
jgi:hypothetical protein